MFKKRHRKRGNQEERPYVCLDDLKPGETAEIIGYVSKTPHSIRLMEMGLNLGKEIKYVKDAPLKDPLQIKIDQNVLSIRRSEAKQILIKLKEDPIE